MVNRKPLQEISVLVGGRAGDGINIAGMMAAWLLNAAGYRPYLYYDYPSLIKGGHNFAVVRGSRTIPMAIRSKVDVVLALNQETILRHQPRMDGTTRVLYHTGFAKGPGLGIEVGEILKRHDAGTVMANSCLLGAFAKTIGLGRDTLVSVMTRHIPREPGKNIAVALEGYHAAEISHPLEPSSETPLPFISGSEAAGLGLISGGLEAYVAYPMTPSSNLLHFLADHGKDAGVTVLHPENEIAVMLSALGFSYAGKKVAVGTSGGGFCLMTEGVSLAGMAEIPVVIYMSQRTGPSTGVPTYSAQSDLHFILHAGHGEFSRFVVAPGTAGEMLVWSRAALEIAWKYQVPAFILTDKHLSEGYYALDPEDTGVDLMTGPPPGDPKMPYRRYTDTGSGVSPLLIPPARGSVIKVNSYAHDESGISTEDPVQLNLQVQKRTRKGESLKEAVTGLPAVRTWGESDFNPVLTCWGSPWGVCRETAEELGARVVRPVVLEPFPVEALSAALAGSDRVIVVEENTGGQLVTLLLQHGIQSYASVRRSDGRPFTIEELCERVQEVI